MTLTKSQKQSLKIINETLKKEHGFTVKIDESVPTHKLNTIRQEFMKEQRELSYSKEAQSNPEYSQCALVLEATNILLGKKKDKPFMFSESTQNRVREIEKLEQLLESISEKQPEKAKVLKSKIDTMRDRIYSESKQEELTKLLNENAQQAEVIMAGKSLFDTVQGFQTKIGELMNKQLDPFIERVRTVYGAEVADKMYSSLEDSLNDLMQQSRTSKEVFYNAVGVLTGEGGDMDDSIDDSEIEAKPDMENDEADDMPDMDMENDGEEDDSDDSEMDLDFDELEGEEEFSRKKE